jgi:hypothetical protein
MLAYDKLFILLSYFNNMRRTPIHTYTSNSNPFYGVLREQEQIDVLVNCQCKITLREVKWDFVLCRNCI